MTFVFPSPRICSLNPTFPLSVIKGDTQRSRLSSRYTPQTPLTNLPVPNRQVYSSDSSKHGPVTITDVPPNMCPRFGRRTSSVVSVAEKAHVCLNTVWWVSIMWQNSVRRRCWHICRCLYQLLGENDINNHCQPVHILPSSNHPLFPANQSYSHYGCWLQVENFKKIFYHY